MKEKVIIMVSLLIIIIVFQFLPGGFFTIVTILILLLFIGIPIFNYIGRKRLDSFISDALMLEGYELISINEYSEHYGVKFIFDSKKYYAKCGYSKSFKKAGEWIDGSPKEVVERKS